MSHNLLKLTKVTSTEKDNRRNNTLEFPCLVKQGGGT